MKLEHLQFLKNTKKRELVALLLNVVEEYIKKKLPLPVHLFALIYETHFFHKYGFQNTVKEKFPKKIYDVCEYCVKKSDCKEIAVEKIIL